MTEKRFYLNEGEVGILKILDLKEDSENIYLTSSKSDMERVVELLNESHEENEQLKQYSNVLNVFKHCKKYKTECKDIYTDLEKEAKE